MILTEEIFARRPWIKQYDWKVPWSFNYPKFPAWHLIRNASNGVPHRPATWFYGTEMTYLELYRACIRLANKLIELGVKKGDRIGILLPNSPQFNLAYWSTLMTGAVVVNLNPLYTYEELKGIATNTGLTGLFTFDLVLPNVKALCKTVDIPLVIVTRISDYITERGSALLKNWVWRRAGITSPGFLNRVPIRFRLVSRLPRMTRLSSNLLEELPGFPKELF